ncbi:hypothetical protein ACFZAE_22040 [Streptomyces scabiei]|nr:hypothetical protein [Streptomyces sp. ATCC 21386]
MRDLVEEGDAVLVVTGADGDPYGARRGQQTEQPAARRGALSGSTAAGD